MFEFNADSVLQGVLGFNRSKTKGESADNDSVVDLDLNYAYSLPQMPRIQVGARVMYNIGSEAAMGDFENYGMQIGAIYNHSADLRNSIYLSLYGGLAWYNRYGAGSTPDDEVISSTLALGKRISLENWGINHLVYTPEIALHSENSTTGSTIEYTQNLELRFLQFSLFF